MFSPSPTKSGQDLVKNAVQAREQRKLSRKREHSAIILQSSVRGFLTRCELGKRWRDELDHMIGFDSELEEKNETSHKEMFLVLKKFLFVFNLKKDEQRFVTLCNYLVHNIEASGNIKMCYVGLSVHKLLVVPWIQQVKKLLWTCCLYLDQCQQQIHQNNSKNSILIYLKLLETFSDITRWKSLLTKGTSLINVVNQLCGKFLLDLNERGCLCVLSSVVNVSCKMALHEVMTSTAFNVAIRIMESCCFSEKEVVTFAFNFLSIPALVMHFNLLHPQCLSQVLDHGLLGRCILLFHVEGACEKHGLIPSHYSPDGVISVLCIFSNLVQLFVIEPNTLVQLRIQCVSLLNQLMKYLYENTTKQKSNLTTWHPVLGYFSNHDARNSHSMQEMKKQLELMWDPVLVRTFFYDVLTLPSLHAETKIHSFPNPNPYNLHVTVTDKLSSYLKSIASSRPKHTLLPTGGRKLEYAEVKNTCCTCLLYKKSLLVFTKQLHLEMLTGLTFMEEVLCRLWRFICELGPTGGLQLFLSALSYHPDQAEPYFAVFTLFCDMTSHILSILDDVEFYEQQVLFHLEELVTISSFLCQFVFKVIWGNLLKDSSSSVYPVYESAHTLLMVLYDRDARRSFTPPGHWLYKEVKSSVIRAEVEKSQMRGKLIMDKIPFILPHKDRVLLFRSLVAADKLKLGITEDNGSMVHIRVHRSRLVEDGFEKLGAMQGNKLKGIIRVKFINDLGLDEAGIDQDGVFKEFLEEIIQKVFNPDMNLFKVTAGGDMKLYPSPLSYLQDHHLHLFTFVGKMLGKAIYEGIVLDIPFANFFLRSILSKQQTALYSPIDELPALDPEFYKNLTWIKRYEGDISELDLRFMHEEDIMGKIQSHELIPGGAGIPVTNENRIMYIHTLAHYRLHTQILHQTKAFVAGFRSVIPTNWISMFSSPELQRLISGDNVDMDLTDLKKHVVYYGGFHSSHRVVRWLWDILEQDYSPSQRSAFLKFVTSCSRPPLLGFANLQPQFSIRCVEVPDDEDTGDTVATVLRGFLRLPSRSRRSSSHNHRLPTASTCFNLLKLPNYPSKVVLKDKLKQAIANNTGFELS
uniref:HECT-type E3 ubiquitin transferase n=1 Tax=Ciona intestinalis TaxID=7719 RepID=F7A8M5_CIOIN